MSHKVLLGTLLVSSAIIGAMAVQLLESPQAVAQAVEEENNAFPFQLVTVIEESGKPHLEIFDRQTGDMFSIFASAGKRAIIGPSAYPAYQIEIDRKGDIIVFESDTGKVWKTKGKQFSLQGTKTLNNSAILINKTIFEPHPENSH